MSQEFDWIDPNTLIIYRFYFREIGNTPHVCISRYDQDGSITMAHRLIPVAGSCIYYEDTWICDGAKQYLNRLIKMRGFW